MSFLDFLLAGDKSGELQRIADEQEADLAAGITWGVFDGDRLAETAPARYAAEFARHDIADGQDRDVSDYDIRPISDEGEGQ
ncbi:MAG TPA: hypothetical protein VK453_25685 [Micromonosporaceae bacterium]|nr:hypothetical protein [Micromonosporaceae bacterium]